MRRIDNRTVELTDREQEASDFWNECLDHGDDILTAVETTALRFPGLPAEFLDYLSN